MPARPHARLSLVLVPACLALVAGCPDEPGPDPDPGPFNLVSADAWGRVTSPDEDAFADQRPADAVCEDVGWYVDPFAQSIEIQTELCDYLTLRQAILHEVGVGDEITVQGYHDDLTAAAPAQGYLGLALDGDIVWEFTVPIPAAAAVFEQTFTVDSSYPADTEIQLHVHNHGPNTWEVISVQVTPARSS
ncbi:hypothetical protein ENSA7_24430 [Enhygromyxa salina]|uniref:Lipoprotein n=2 Tax=Enhygromyxa salina TaxID=215803 RepID=A0A2S9YS17_9BACT|nr:hypothetical protein ENSA7_24430 [Enhygromyxa salina]